MKTCSKCKVEKPRSEFHRRGKNLLASSCKVCRSEERKAKYIENPDPIKERSRRWRQENPEKAKELDRLSRSKNAEKRSAQSKAWREKNLDKALESSRAYYAANREKLLAMARERRRSNPEKVASVKLKHYHAVQKHKPEFKAAEAARRALKRTLNRTGNTKRKRTEGELGYSFETLRSHLENNFSDGMSWDNYGEWHIDHIVPVMEMIRLGITCPKKINALSNLRPVWSHENISKGDGFALVSPLKT